MTQHDLLISGGTVIDPASGLHAPADVAIADGRIAAVESHGQVSSAGDVLDAVDAHDDAKVTSLAARDDPDPWLVADLLLARGRGDAAASFATLRFVPVTVAPLPMNSSP